MPSTYVRNPSFDGQLERGISNALNAAGRKMGTDTRWFASWSSTIPAATKTQPVSRSATGPSVRVTVEKPGFKSNFFEDGTGSRSTRAGHNRGSVGARPHKQPALDAAVRRGLNLSRYL